MNIQSFNMIYLMGCFAFLCVALAIWLSHCQWSNYEVHVFGVNRTVPNHSQPQHITRRCILLGVCCNNKNISDIFYNVDEVPMIYRLKIKQEREKQNKTKTVNKQTNKSHKLWNHLYMCMGDRKVFCNMSEKVSNLPMLSVVYWMTKHICAWSDLPAHTGLHVTQRHNDSRMSWL